MAFKRLQEAPQKPMSTDLGSEMHIANTFMLRSYADITARSCRTLARSSAPYKPLPYHGPPAERQSLYSVPPLAEREGDVPLFIA